jgi:hypothetical protein
MRQFIGTVQDLGPPPAGSRFRGRYGIQGTEGPLAWDCRNAFGGFQAADIGKEVWRVDGVLQMENDAQRAARLARGKGSV